MLREKLKTGLLRPLLLLAALLALSQSAFAWDAYYFRPSDTDWSADNKGMLFGSWSNNQRELTNFVVTKTTKYEVYVEDGGTSKYYGNNDAQNGGINEEKEYNIWEGGGKITLNPGIYTLKVVTSNSQSDPYKIKITKTSEVLNNYYFRPDGSDYSENNKGILLTWSGSNNRYQKQSLTLTKQTTYKLYVEGDNNNVLWCGPGSGQSPNLSVNQQVEYDLTASNSSNITLSAGTYAIYVTTAGGEHNVPNKIIIKRIENVKVYTINGTWAESKSFTNNAYSFGAGSYDPGYIFNLYEDGARVTAASYYDTSTIVSAGGDSYKLRNTPGVGDQVTFKIKMVSGKPVLYAEVKPVYYSYHIYYQENSTGPNDTSGTWGTQCSTSIEGGRSVTVIAKLKKNTHFGIKSQTNAWYGPSTNNFKVNAGSSVSAPFASHDNNFLWDGDDEDVEVTLTLDRYGKLSNVKFAPVTPKVTYYLHYGDEQAAGWSSSKSVQVPVGGSAEFTAYMYPTYNFTISGNGTYYGSVNDVVFTDGVTTTDIITDNTRKDYQWRGGQGPVTVTITLDNDGNLVKILANGPAVGQVIEDHKARPIYLLAPQLNGNEPSPEWQMEHMGEGIYVLRNFAMRPYETKQDEYGQADVPFIRIYDVNGKNPYDITFKTDEFKATLPKKGALGSNALGASDWGGHYEDKGGMSPGWAYNATFYFDTETLTMTPVSGATPDMESSDILPFISILGENFYQSKQYNTRRTGSVDHPDDGTTHTTDDKWQEAYIQYDSNGNPIIGDDGKAYYNTYWPPRNNILMVSKIGDEILPTSVNGLSLDRDSRILQGNDWRMELRDEFGSNYDNLSLDGKYYVRYSVSNMWMLGTFKLWTGWAGYKANWGAYWNGHLFWGAPKDGDTNVGFNKLMDAPSDHNGINFTTPIVNNVATKAYYRTMELYIPVTLNTNGNITGYDFYNARLYTTQSAGGATIDSKGYDDDKNNAAYMHAGFNPDFSAWPQGYNLTSYTITRYKYDPNAEEGSYEPCDKDGVVHYDEDGEIDPSFGEVKTFTGTCESRDDFRKQFSFAGSGALKGYVDNGKYAPGMYIYSMEVEFTNPTDKKTLKDVVWSPYVHLVDRDVKANVACAQLIELDDANLDGQYGDFTHITFSTSNDGLLVKIDNGGNVTKAARLSSYLSGRTPAEVRNRCREIYEMYGRWTNKALLSTSIPTSYTQQGGLRKDITTFGIYKDAGCTVAVDNGSNLQNTTAVGGSYYRVFQGGTEFGSHPFYAKFVGKINNISVGEGADNIASATYLTRFPLPRLGQANFDLITSDGEINVQVTHDALQEPVVAQTVANSLNFDIPIAMPRISREGGLAEAVYKQLAVVLERRMEAKTAENEGPTEVWDGDTYEVKDGQKVSEVFDVYSNEDTLLRYEAQSPFDWMSVDETQTIKTDESGQPVLDADGRPVYIPVAEGETIDPLTGRVWTGVERKWRIINSRYKDSGITPYVPTLFVNQMDITLNCSFYTPTVQKANVYKVNVPARDENGEVKPNTYVCRVYLMNIKWGKAQDSSIGTSEDELKEDFTSLPVAFTDMAYNNHNSPLYAVVARRNVGGQNVDYATSILTLDNSVDTERHFLLWESPEFHWYAEMDSFDPGITLLVSRAYAFYAANDKRAEERYSHFNGVLSPQTELLTQGKSKMAIRYDYKEEGEIPVVPNPEVEPVEPQQSPMRVMRRAEGEQTGNTPNDPVIGDISGAGDAATTLAPNDNSFLFVPRYADASKAMGPILTSIDLLDADEAGVEAGVGYIDVKGNFAIIFDASGKMVYTGDSRVDVPAGVYVVNLRRGSTKVIVR